MHPDAKEGDEHASDFPIVGCRSSLRGTSDQTAKRSTRDAKVSSCSRVLGRILEFSRRALLIVRMVIQRCLPRLLAGPYTGPTHAVRLSARRREQPALFEPERQEECKVATAVLVEVDADEAARRSANGSTECSRSAWSRMMSRSVPQRLERLGRRNLLPCTVTARDSSTHTE